MEELLSVLSREEIVSFTLRSLYSKFGYCQYKMSKFEEYDLYVRNKAFLVSENVITFTDTDGKLLALKPDVTLSIIKNSKDVTDGLMKVYYNENVYRVSKGTQSFKEIMQAGLECLGNVDDDTITEVLFLAANSLNVISESNVLEVSHLDIVSGVLNALNISDFGKEEIFKCLGEKNEQGLVSVCKKENVSESNTLLVKKLVTTYGNPCDVLPNLDEFCINDEVKKSVEQLKNIINNLNFLGVNDKLCIDFSVVNDMKYYNGVAFKGFIEGIPTGILSGGQYDSMMKMMQKKSKAIGFAVYLDELSKLSVKGGENND